LQSFQNFFCNSWKVKSAVKLCRVGATNANSSTHGAAYASDINITHNTRVCSV